MKRQICTAAAVVALAAAGAVAVVGCDKGDSENGAANSTINTPPKSKAPSDTRSAENAAPNRAEKVQQSAEAQQAKARSGTDLSGSDVTSSEQAGGGRPAPGPGGTSGTTGAASTGTRQPDGISTNAGGNTGPAATNNVASSPGARRGTAAPTTRPSNSNR